MSESLDPPDNGAADESIGALLSRVRMEQGKSQLRVAELLCAASGLATITRHEISRWEREERIPGGSWLRWLAVVLDTPLDELERAAARGPSTEGDDDDADHDANHDADADAIAGTGDRRRRRRR